MKQGVFIIVIGPTGSGKSTLMKHVIAAHPELVIPYSYTTRAPRPDHVENNHYKFITKEEFQQKIDAGEFLEWAEYSGNFYGTLKSEIEADLAQGMVLLKEMEVQGARQIRELLPKDKVLFVFVSAGEWEALEARVRARAPITEEELAQRKKRFEDEITFIPEADVVIENTDGNKDEAMKQFSDLIQTNLTNHESR